MPEARSAIFFDTVTLSNFAFAARLDVILKRYGNRALVTPEVLDEVSEGIAVGHTALQVIETALDDGALGLAAALSGTERQTYRKLLRVLAPGEASCIACSCTRGGVVATDDRAARSLCAEYGVVVTGTIGILKACARDGVISPAEADDALQRMVESGYHSPVRLISSLL